MCFYNANEMACGCWKWGHFRMHCAKEYRTAQTCGMKLVMERESLSERCRTCTKIVNKEISIAKEYARIERWSREGNRSASIAKAQDEITKLQDDLLKLNDDKMARIGQMGNMKNEAVDERALVKTLVGSDTEEFKDVEVEELEDLVAISLKSKTKEIYPAKLHARSVAKKLGVNSGLICIAGLREINWEDSDQPMKWRQRRYFYYISGINFPGVIVTYEIRRDSLCAWIPPPNTGANVIFNGSVPTIKEVKAEYDFDDVQYTSDLDDCLIKFVHYNPGEKVYQLHPSQAPSVLRQAIQIDGSRSYDSKLPFDFSKLQPAMNAARVIKSPYEIKMIRKANEISAQAHINVLRGIRNLENEAEIEAIFLATCVAEQAKEQSYGIIAGSGPNASTLHYMANNEPLKGRQLVCLDAGAEWKCYASDVTRTFPISGEFSPEAKAIYDIVSKMQEECIAMIKPRVDWLTIVQHSVKVAVEGLLKLDILQNGTAEELYSLGAWRAFFPHGLGHYVGLEVHDVGTKTDRLGFLSEHNPAGSFLTSGMEFPAHISAGTLLEPNMVVTVEPGLYFSRYALEDVYLKNPITAKYINKDLLAKYYPVGGVRIEDDILVTENGYENLTTAPKGEAALKIINEGKEKKLEIRPKKGWFW